MSGEIVSAWPGMGSWGEAVLFWSVAALMVMGALGVLLFKKAAYAALSMVVVMLGMAVLFFSLEAPFNGAVQIIVYTGAIMMLFLFVIMMIGLGATDGYREQNRTHIWIAVGMGVALAVMTVAAIFTSKVPGPGNIEVDPYSNAPITGLAATLFQDHWFTIELSAMLLIVAAVGAVLLTHSDRLRAKFGQRRTAEARMKEYSVKGAHLGQTTAPGVYATSNSVDNPAISGESGTVIEDSIPRVLRLRGLEKPLGALEPEVAQSLQLARQGQTEKTLWAPAQKVSQSYAWGMPGAPAPTGLNQLRQSDLSTEISEEEQQ